MPAVFVGIRGISRIVANGMNAFKIYKKAVAVNEIMKVLVVKDSIVYNQMLALGKYQIRIAKETFQFLESVWERMSRHKMH